MVRTPITLLPTQPPPRTAPPTHMILLLTTTLRLRAEERCMYFSTRYYPPPTQHSPTTSSPRPKCRVLEVTPPLLCISWKLHRLVHCQDQFQQRAPLRHSQSPPQAPCFHACATPIRKKLTDIIEPIGQYYSYQISTLWHTIFFT